MTWWDILKIVAASSVVSSLITLGLNWLKDWYSSAKGNAFLAMRIASALERTAADAIDAKTQSVFATSPDWRPALPKISLPTEGPWERLDADLVDEILAFESKVYCGQLTTNLLDELGTADAYVDHAVATGKEAIRLARKTRRIYKLRPVGLPDEQTLFGS